MNRRPHRLLVRWIVVALLLAQWAIASHACAMVGAVVTAAGQSALEATEVSALADGQRSGPMQMVDCEQMTSTMAYAEDIVCAEHCKFGDQGDSPATPAFPGGFPPLAHASLSPDDALLTQRMVQARRDSLTLSPPPHAILHCVLRT